MVSRSISSPPISPSAGLGQFPGVFLLGDMVFRLSITVERSVFPVHRVDHGADFFHQTEVHIGFVHVLPPVSGDTVHDGHDLPVRQRRVTRRLIGIADFLVDVLFLIPESVELTCQRGQRVVSGAVHDRRVIRSEKHLSVLRR